MRPVDISIVVPTKNGEPWIRRMLEAISSQETAKSYEVIVIDSGSSDHTLEEVGYFSTRVVSIPPEEFGHGTTRNLGAQLAEGIIVVYLSQDAIPASEKWLDALVAPLQGPSVAAVYGKQTAHATASPLMRFLQEYFYPNHQIERRDNSNTAFSFRSILFSNANSAILKDMLIDNPFAEDLLMSEDQEFALRVLGKGWSIIYEPAAVVWHSNEYSLRQLFRRNFDSAYSLRDIQRDGFGNRARDGIRYLSLELAYLARAGHWLHIPRAIVWETVRGMAFIAGSKGESIPNGLRKKMSQRPEFWRSREQVTLLDSRPGS